MLKEREGLGTKGLVLKNESVCHFFAPRGYSTLFVHEVSLQQQQ